MGAGEAEACCCSCIVILLIFTVPITLISISLVTHTPKLSISDLYIPALNTTTPSNSTKLNTFVFVELKLRNVMHLNGLRYESLNLTFFYASNRSSPVGTSALAGFYQGHRKTAYKSSVVRTRGLPWEDAFDRVARGLTVDLVFELEVVVKLRRCGKYMKRRMVVRTADVSFDGSGGVVDGKSVELH